MLFFEVARFIKTMENDTNNDSQFHINKLQVGLQEGFENSDKCHMVDFTSLKPNIDSALSFDNVKVNIKLVH